MEWTIENKKLVNEFTFKNFVESVEFVDKIVPLAQDADHHPDIFIHSYKKVMVILFTHSEDKITNKDHDLAGKIDELV